MRTVVRLPIILVGLGLVACDEKKDGSSQTPATSSSAANMSATKTAPKEPENLQRGNHPGNEEGAKALLESFMKPDADRSALSKSLRPSAKDYGSIFVADVADKARLAYDEQWDKGAYVIEVKEGQSNLLLWKATTEELREGTGDSNKFPGGYKKIANQLKPGLTFYRFKFVKPDDKHGMAFDGLVHVNGHWVLVSKPYRAL